MNNKNKGFSGVVGLVIILSLVINFYLPREAFAATAPNLGTAASYAIWGKAGVTNSGAGTHIWGDVGADLLSNITGLIASQVDGSIAGPTPGVQTAISSAYGQLNAQSADGAQSLSGIVTIIPGTWTVGAATLNGTVTLDGAGVYILRSSSDITVSSGAQVSLINGATACNVFWQVPGSMTIGVGAHVEGTIITDTALISLATGASLVGRALSTISQVTLDTNQITQPACSGGGGSRRAAPAYPLISVTKIPSPLTLPSGPGSVTFTYTATNIGTVAMNDVWVRDDKCSPVEYVSGDTDSDSLLDTDEDWAYSCTKTVSVTETNTVTAHGAAANGEMWDTANATVSVGTTLTPPLIHIVKVPNTFVLPAGGGPVTYQYTVTNPGVAPLGDVSVIDDKCIGLPGRVVGHPGDLNKNDLLESNEAWEFTCQAYLTQSTTNTGTAQGSANGLTAVDYTTATVVVSPASAPGPLPIMPSAGIFSEDNSVPWYAYMLALSGIFIIYNTMRRNRTV